MAKKREHTGFRNGNLFCFNCGTSQALPLPMPANLASEWTKGFVKLHKACPKTWQEPVNEGDSKSEYENVQWWATNGEHGVSSKTMFNHLSQYTKLPNQHGPDRPYDPDDFRRCYLLIKAIPQWKEKLHMLNDLSPVWANLVANWDKLTEMTEEQLATKRPNGMYEFMKSLGC